MLDHVRATTLSPFFAPRFLIARWEKEERQLSFGGFEITVGPVTEDALKDNWSWQDLCPVEATLHRAVAPIREAVAWEVVPDRWTQSLDGWGCPVQGGWQGFDEPPPAHVVDLIATAFPLPRTFDEALDEVTYWAWRVTMALMCLGYGETPFGAVSDPCGGDPGLDLTVFVRLSLLRPMVLHKLPTVTLAEILTRLQIYGEMDQKDLLIEAAVMRGLEALGDFSRDMLKGLRARHATEVAAAAAPKGRRKGEGKGRRRGCQNPQVRIELLRHRPEFEPGRIGDREIARMLGVSQSTVVAEHDRLIEAGLIDPAAVTLVARKNVQGRFPMNPRGRRAKAVTPKPVEGGAATASPVPEAVVATEPAPSPEVAPAPEGPSGPDVGKEAKKVAMPATTKRRPGKGAAPGPGMVQIDWVQDLQQRRPS